MNEETILKTPNAGEAFMGGIALGGGATAALFSWMMSAAGWVDMWLFVWLGGGAAVWGAFAAIRATSSRVAPAP